MSVINGVHTNMGHMCNYDCLVCPMQIMRILYLERVTGGLNVNRSKELPQKHSKMQVYCKQNNCIHLSIIETFKPATYYY